MVLITLTLPACTTQKLYSVNERINSYKYIPDKVNHLSTPAEFYANGGGDCEDFANAKRQALIDDGIPEQNIKFVFIPISWGVGHVMLEADGYVLDNRTDKILQSYQVKSARFTMAGLLTVGKWQ